MTAIQRFETNVIARQYKTLGFHGYEYAINFCYVFTTRLPFALLT